MPLFRRRRRSSHVAFLAIFFSRAPGVIVPRRYPSLRPAVFRRTIKHSYPSHFEGLKNSHSSSVSPLIQPIGLLGERVAESMTHPDARELSSLIINTPGSYQLKKGLEVGARMLSPPFCYRPHCFAGDDAHSLCKNIFLDAS